MNFRIFTIIAAIICMTLMTNAYYSINKTVSIDIVDRSVYYIEFYPRTVIANKGDILTLKFDNRSRVPVKIFIPMYNVNLEIPKVHSDSVTIDLSDPPSNLIWFQVGSPEKKISGYIMIKDPSENSDEF